MSHEGEIRQYTRERPGGVEFRIVTSPDGRPGALVQLPDGFVIFNDPDELREFVAEASLLWHEFRQLVAEQGSADG